MNEDCKNMWFEKKLWEVLFPKRNDIEDEVYKGS
jgi:hypothetical protein